MQSDDNTTESPFAGLSKKIRSGESAAAQEYKNRPPTIFVTRRRNGARLRLRGIRAIIVTLATSFRATLEAQPFTVELDGEPAGTLSSGDTLQIEVAAGLHRLRISTKVANSRELPFEVEYGQRLKFSCFCTMTGVNLMRED